MTHVTLAYRSFNIMLPNHKWTACICDMDDDGTDDEVALALRRVPSAH